MTDKKQNGTAGEAPQDDTQSNIVTIPVDALSGVVIYRLPDGSVHGHVVGMARQNPRDLYGLLSSQLVVLASTINMEEMIRMQEKMAQNVSPIVRPS